MRFWLLLCFLLAPGRLTAAPADADLRALERQLHVLVNHERQARGLPTLRLNEELSRVARAHSRDMRDRRFFGHFTPEGRAPFDRVRAAGLACARVGENLALDRTVDAPHRVMMAEPPDQPNHRAVILNRHYAEIGVGIEADGDWLYITEDFTAPGTVEDAVWENPVTGDAETARLRGAVDAAAARLARMSERLGRLSLLAGDPKGAAQSFEAALREDPRSPGAHAGLGEASERLGQAEVALREYTEALAVSPDDHPTRLRLAGLLLNAGKPVEAETHYRLVTRAQKENPEAWYGAARSAAAAGQAAEARDLLRRALALDASLRKRAEQDPALSPLLR